MKKIFTSAGIACRIWILTSLMLGVGISLYILYAFPQEFFPVAPLSMIACVIGSVPAFIILFVFIKIINRSARSWQVKFSRLLLVEFFITVCYSMAAISVNFLGGTFYGRNPNDLFFTGIVVFAILFACTLSASLIILRIISAYFSGGKTANLTHYDQLISVFLHKHKNSTNMETFEPGSQSLPEPPTQSNRILIKGLITGGLILLMLIPTIFINNLITERETRHKEVVKEVSTKWATAQTVSGPYLVVPYADTIVNADGRVVPVKKQLILLANDLNVTGAVSPEERPRSIYKVLLYKSDLHLAGSFKSKWPADINPSNIDFTNARLCFGISDFKGIEKEIHINFNKQALSFSPGLPINDLNNLGLSVPVSFTVESMNGGIPFDMQIKLKGSEQLHFMPLGANSKFALKSSWPSPSFDGSVLPDERKVTSKGFTATWSFNQANLPFGTVLKSGSFNHANLAFGVSMVQPADQYNKTMRSVKYAILFIGLTFSLFFIMEIMQRKPFHPAQYVLVGLALVIFYTLLLSISEYLLFDHAYLIASSATVVLITLYSKSHFLSWKTAAVFGSVLSSLYGFIFILIRLEDTALLVGSIGLFIVLAIVMYVSRKINWYGGDSRYPISGI